MIKQFFIILGLIILTIPIFSQDTTLKDSANLSIKNTRVQPINLSFVYPVSLYGKQAKDNNYYFSLNVLGGKVNDIRILEIGGLYNMDNNVQFVQIGGVFNKVNDIAGLQIGGFANIASGNGTAIQVGGLVNIVKKEALGIRVAGLGNMIYGENVGIELGGIGNMSMGEFTGIQVAGLFNYTKQQAIGLQVGGLFNYAQHDAMGLQLSMLSNISMGLGAGLQITGLLNLMNNYSGLEVAGITNIALLNTFGFALAGITNITLHDFKGIEVSLFNYVGRSSNGIQVGLINYADTIGKGVALGLINIIKKGRYSEVEMATTNTIHLSVNYKLGLKKFYNIYGVGYSFSYNPFIHFGLGLGGKYSFNKYVAFQPEIVNYTYFHPNNFSSYLGNTTHLSLGITYDINDRFSITAAPTIYVNIDDKKNNLDFEPITSLTKPFYKKETNNKRTIVGVGYKIGLAVKL